MHLLRTKLAIPLLFAVLAQFSLACIHSHAQAAMLMEEPYGFFGFLNPTGHDAVYFERICAENPLKLRRCLPGELGAVITRYQGIAHYDWLAVPLIPYLYSVETSSEVPSRVDHDTVIRLREKYHDAHLQIMGKDVPRGGDRKRGWSQLVGAAYDRRIYVFRFATTIEQDDALIARLNHGPNHSRFNLLYANCADWTGNILNSYFPGTFRRSILPDAGITTPRQISYKLTRYARNHPETRLTVFEIPQVPGNRRHSHANKSIAKSLITSGYVVPFGFVSPYIVAGILVDYLGWGRYPLDLKRAEVLKPEHLAPLLTLPADSTPAPHSTAD
jgi:hypothetical protein